MSLGFALGCRTPGSGHQISPEHRELVRVLGAQRPFIARLVGFDVHGDCPPDGFCVELPASNEPSYRSLITAGGSIRRAARDTPSAEHLHALGIWQLLGGRRTGSMADAVTSLRRAVVLAPGRAGARSDLAAAHLMRGLIEGNLWPFIEALHQADRALELQPGLRPALFNRVLALEALHLDAEAAAARDELERLEADPAWRREALQPPLRTSAEALATARRRLLDEVIPAWTERILARDRDAARRLALEAREIGRSIEEKTGDSLPARIAAPVFENGRDHAVLARALTEYAAGVAAYRQREIGRAVAHFENAEPALADLDHPAWLWARYHLAACQYWEDVEEAWSRFTGLRPRAVAEGYSGLLGYIDWMMGLIEVERGDLGRGAELYRGAVEHFRRAVLPGEAATVHVLLADLLRRNGDERGVFEALHKALPDIAQMPMDAWRYAAWSEISKAAQAGGRLAASLYFENRALESALAMDRATTISDAHRTRAELRARLGDQEGMREDLAAALRVTETISDQKARRRAEAVLLSTEGRLDAEGAPRAIEPLTRAIEYHISTEAWVVLPDLLAERSRRHLQLGEIELAERDLARAIELIEERQPAGQRPSELAAFLAAARTIYERMVALQIDQRTNEELALEYAERSRRLGEFSAAMRPGAVGSGAVAGAMAALDEKSAAIATFALPERLLVWLVSAEGVELRSHPVALESLRAAVRGTVEEIADRRTDEKTRRRLTLLHDLLIAPFAERLAGRERLFFVLDSTLGALPLAALVERQSGRHLIESHLLALLPDLGSALPPNRPTLPGGSPGGVLLIGDPAFDPARHPGLERLPSSRREVEALAAGPHRGALLLTGQAATRRRLLAEMPGRRLIHFAGHARVDPAEPEASGLVLASRPGADEDWLRPRDIRALQLGGTDLVVLAACRSGNVSGHAGGRYLEVGHPFLRAGAERVLSTLWAIDDAETHDFLLRFHELHAAGQAAERALRVAQLEAIEQSGASLEALGGWAPFQITVRGLGGGSKKKSSEQFR